MSDNKKTVIALGYFDSVHIGHRKVISEAVSLAESLGAQTVVFTFSGNLKSVTENKNSTVVYGDEERQQIYSRLGITHTKFAPLTAEFLSKTKNEFLEYLDTEYDVLAYVCGEDYRFGKSRSGDAEYLCEFAKQRGRTVKVVKTVCVEGEKVSTSKIKTLLSSGEIKKANLLLGEPYSLMGTVVKDRGVGRSLGFPTANLVLSDDRCKLGQGVYYGKTQFDGKSFLSVINYGARPTFSLGQTLCESHLIGFDGDLYGKTVKVVFDGYLRDIKKFQNKTDLIDQIENDVKEVKDATKN